MAPSGPSTHLGPGPLESASDVDDGRLPVDGPFFHAKGRLGVTRVPFRELFVGFFRGIHATVYFCEHVYEICD